MIDSGLTSRVIAMTRLVKPESIMSTLEDRIPANFLSMNQTALAVGMELAEPYAA